MSLKLIYFKMRALAEAPLMLMHCHNIEHEYLMSWEHFEDVWAKVKPKIAFRQLPMLEVDNSTQICQSIAILQFLESRAGLLSRIQFRRRNLLPFCNLHKNCFSH